MESKNIQGSKISTQAGGNIKQKQENMYSCLEEYKGLEQIKDLQVGEYNSGGNTGNNPTPTQYSRNPGVN